MAWKVAVIVVATAVLATVNRYLIDAYWAELVFTALVTGAMAFCLSRMNRRL
ncbi:hypothetical protein [Streptomyces hundungensis]|uniref:hypothetical protein n=1 Tax=Streptomyces hundungensis TaxID=1077946 RepID=UPI0033E436F0